MSTEILGFENHIYHIRIHGKLTHEELAAVQRGFAKEISDDMKAPILVDARTFDGWAKDQDWGNLDAQYEAEPKISRMAIVADPRWDTLVTAFSGKGIRRFPIEIFSPEDWNKAMEWLRSPAAS